MNIEFILNLLRSDGSICVNKTLAHAIGLNCAVMFSELCSRFFYFKNKNELDKDGFFYNTVEDLEEGTCMNDYLQRKCINELKKLGLIEVKIAGLPAKRYFKITTDEKILFKFLDLKNLKPSSKKIKELDVQNFEANNTNINNNKNNTNIKEKKHKEKPVAKTATVESKYSQNENLDKTIKDFIAMRKKTKAPMTDRAIELLLLKLKKIAPDNENLQIDILNQSIFNSWKGIYELKKENQSAYKPDDPNAGYTVYTDFGI